MSKDESNSTVRCDGYDDVDIWVGAGMVTVNVRQADRVAEWDIDEVSKLIKALKKARKVARRNGK